MPILITAANEYVGQRLEKRVGTMGIFMED